MASRRLARRDEMMRILALLEVKTVMSSWPAAVWPRRKNRSIPFELHSDEYMHIMHIRARSTTW
jgi:hypothetical protein